MGDVMTSLLARDVESGEMSLEEALCFHLRLNMRPPAPYVAVPMARTAIERAREGRLEERMQGPRGMELPSHLDFVTAGWIIEALHLEPFLDPRREYQASPEETMASKRALEALRALGRMGPIIMPYLDELFASASDPSETRTLRGAIEEIVEKLSGEGEEGGPAPPASRMKGGIDREQARFLAGMKLELAD